MQRPSPVIAVSVIEIFGALCAFGMAALVMLSAVIATAAPVAQRPAGPIWIGAAILLLAAGWGLATALGLLWLRLWALISTLLFSFLMVCAALGMIATVLNPLPGAPAQAVAAVYGFALVAGLMLLGLAIWWIAYFSRARTHAAFFALRKEGATPRLPISLNVIAWALIAAGAGCVLVLPMLGRRALFFLGPHPVTGVGAEIGYLVLGAVGLVIGVGVLELRRWARVAAIVWLLAGMFISIVLWMTPGAYLKMLQSASQFPGAVPAPAPGYYVMMIVISAAAGVAQIYFLWTRDAAFQPLRAIAAGDAVAANGDRS